MWYNCQADVEVFFEIDVDAETASEAHEIAVTEALKRIKLPSTVSIVNISVNVAKDQSSGKVR